MNLDELYWGHRQVLSSLSGLDRPALTLLFFPIFHHFLTFHLTRMDSGLSDPRLGKETLIDELLQIGPPGLKRKLDGMRIPPCIIGPGIRLLMPFLRAQSSQTYLADIQLAKSCSILR